MNTRALIEQISDQLDDAIRNENDQTAARLAHRLELLCQITGEILPESHCGGGLIGPQAPVMGGSSSSPKGC